MYEADGFRLRNEFDRGERLRKCAIARNGRMRDGPGTAGAAEHTMFAVRQGPGMMMVVTLP